MRSTRPTAHQFPFPLSTEKKLAETFPSSIHWLQRYTQFRLSRFLKIENQRAEYSKDLSHFEKNIDP